LLLLPDRLAVGTSMAITLTTPRGDLATEGTVVWIEPDMQTGRRLLTRHGVRFVDARPILDALLTMTLEGAPEKVGRKPAARSGGGTRVEEPRVLRGRTRTMQQHRHQPAARRV
jgi:hypothetical protein